MNIYNIEKNILRSFKLRVIEIEIFRLIQILASILVPFFLYYKISKDIIEVDLYKFILIGCFIEFWLLLFFLQSTFVLKENKRRIIKKVEIFDTYCKITSISNEVVILNKKVYIYKFVSSFKESLIQFYNKSGILPSPFTKKNGDTYVIECINKLHIYPKLFDAPEKVYEILKQYAIESSNIEM